MESNIKSSFIPQSPIAPSRAAARTSGGGFDLFILLGIVIFVASATLAVGVFLYSQYLTTSAASKLEQLERAKQAFEPSLISDLTRLDSRMRTASEILESHIAPTALFQLLEQLTLQTVAFSSFDFSASEEGLTLDMRGIAQSVNSIALQADLLAKSGVISSPIFSNINRQINGVNFDFTAEVNAGALNYANQVNPSGAPETQESIPEEPASPFGTPQDGGQGGGEQAPQNQTPTQGQPPAQQGAQPAASPSL
jgi:hypothetical protein